MSLAAIWNAGANPQGLTVRGGAATATVNGPQLNVTVSQNAFLNWQSFNIAPGQTTTFIQPSPASVVWNKINDPNPSRIWGHLDANGVVVLMNPSGFFFGPGSEIHAAGLVATTASPTANFGAGGAWEFTGPPPAASIINYGEIKTARGGSAYLIAENVENHGNISAPDGKIGLSAGQEVLLSDRPDGRGLSVKVTLPNGSVDNTGKLVADGGAIRLQAQAVNQSGLLQADSVRQHNGVIELFASERLTLGAGSRLEARGEGPRVSDGGRVTIQSHGTFTDAPGSEISVAGGPSGGNGGTVEISAPVLAAVHSKVDGGTAPGGMGGKLVLDPTDINLGSSGTGSAGSGTVAANTDPGTLNLNVNSAFTGFSQIDLQATHDINVTPGTTWDLGQSTGVSSPGSHLTLEAGHDITVADGAGIVAESGWSVTLEAGRDFATPNQVQPGVGGIYFQGSGSLQTQNGAIGLVAGKEVSVGSGSVRTEAGGNLTVTALSGSINTGTDPNGFQFLPSGAGYQVDPNLGGISTAAGGNVSITAGQDITSYLPINGSATTDGGSGAFGSAPGNVTLTAGGTVTGHFVLINGTGVIHADQNAGTTTRQLALSLAHGDWTVSARDIVLQEARNPNGIFNSRGFGASVTKHFFDYSPDASVTLDAADSVQLLGGSLPRNAGTFEQELPSIYPPTLDITAGAGGVQIANDVVLFPSPLGQLDITTTAGGSLTGTKPGDLVQLAMSDSAGAQYRSVGSFGADDHAPVPVHLNDPIPVTLNIAGDLANVLLVSPKSADITVGGNMVNSRFDVQNLRPTDVTSVNVAGDIVNRNEFTSVPLDQAPDV
ncbi:MAG: filamentous hemagglutinin N-terminal domain-containing protein, partial [Verrucomicrobia bacterium]|nr:filamentous hemagglutinin N-terminal domain-containing protein [Verrucomicrobiota bacterium]